jgi:hypothetical protein
MADDDDHRDLSWKKPGTMPRRFVCCESTGCSGGSQAWSAPSVFWKVAAAMVLGLFNRGNTAAD